MRSRPSARAAPPSGCPRRSRAGGPAPFSRRASFWTFSWQAFSSRAWDSSGGFDLLNGEPIHSRIRRGDGQLARRRMWIGGWRRTTAGGRLDRDERRRRGPQGATAALLRPDAVRPQDRCGRPHHRFRRRLSRDHRAGRERGRARSDPRRRGEDRRRHPQADVRAADALQLRGRRHHRRQSERLLRARHPPRDAAALDGDPVRGGNDPAVRHRAAARHPVPDQRAGRAVQPGRLRRGDREAAARGEEEPARRQSAVSAARLHAAQRGRSYQDRHVPRPLQLFEEVQRPARRRAAAGRAGGQGGGRRSRVQEPARSRDRRDRRHVPDACAT